MRKKSLNSILSFPFFILFLVLVLFSSGLTKSQAEPESASGGISIDLKSVDIIELLSILSLKTGRTIVPGKSLSGRITISLHNVSFDDVLDIILLSQGLACHKSGEIIYVMTNPEYKAIQGKDYLEARKMSTVKLNYAKPAGIFNAISQLKSEIGKIIVDEASGTIILMDIPEKLGVMENTIRELDQPKKMEKLEAIVKTLDEEGKRQKAKGKSEKVKEEVREEKERIKTERQEARKKKELERQEAKNKKEMERKQAKEIKEILARQDEGREAVEKKEAKILKESSKPPSLPVGDMAQSQEEIVPFKSPPEEFKKPYKSKSGLLAFQAEIHYKEGLSLQGSGNPAEAKVCYHKVILLDHQYAPAYNQLGIISQEEDLLEEAEAYYLKAIEADPKFAPAYSNLALLAEVESDFEKAAEYWQKRVKLGRKKDPWVKLAKKRLKEINPPSREGRGIR